MCTKHVWISPLRHLVSCCIVGTWKQLSDQQIHEGSVLKNILTIYRKISYKPVCMMDILCRICSELMLQCTNVDTWKFWSSQVNMRRDNWPCTTMYYLCQHKMGNFIMFTASLCRSILHNQFSHFASFILYETWQLSAGKR